MFDSDSGDKPLSLLCIFHYFFKYFLSGLYYILASISENYLCLHIARYFNLYYTFFSLIMPYGGWILCNIILHKKEAYPYEQTSIFNFCYFSIFIIEFSLFSYISFSLFAITAQYFKTFFRMSGLCCPVYCNQSKGHGKSFLPLKIVQ